MENLVPLGTGNSRLMKSNIPSNTTLAQLIQMWNNGTFPYDIGPLNSAGISQQGTPLNKDTLLKDATAALYVLGSDAVPDDVLAKLANAAFVENGGLTDVGGNSVGIQIATGSYVGTGTYGASNPNSLTFSFTPKIWGIVFMTILGSFGNVSAYVLPNIFYWGVNNNFSIGNITSRDSVGTYEFNSIEYTGSTVKWWQENQAENQLNLQNGVYYYFALG